MKAAYVVSGLALLTLGCAADRRTLPPPVQTTASASSTEPARCVPLQTKAWFNCWWSGPDAPFTHCLFYSEDEPACGLKARGGAYLTRGAPGGGNLLDNKRPTWQIISIHEDEQGRVGMAAERMDGSRFLAHHDQSPPPTGRPTEPIWPRWPSELEFGPEQAARP